MENMIEQTRFAFSSDWNCVSIRFNVSRAKALNRSRMTTKFWVIANETDFDIDLYP